MVIGRASDGSLSIISAARSAGGGGFDEDDEAIVRLYNKGKRSEQKGVIKKVRAGKTTHEERFCGTGA